MNNINNDNQGNNSTKPNRVSPLGGLGNRNTLNEKKEGLNERKIPKNPFGQKINNGNAGKFNNNTINNKEKNSGIFGGSKEENNILKETIKTTLINDKISQAVKNTTDNFKNTRQSISEDKMKEPPKKEPTKLKNLKEENKAKSNFEVPKSVDSFQEKVKEYNSLLDETKHKTIVNKLLKNKEYTLEEKISLLKDFVQAEKDIEKIPNPNLQNFLLEKIENNELKDTKVSEFVSKIKNDYLVANTIKPRIALGKVIEEKIENNEPIPIETQKQIKDIFNVPQELANDLGLDLGLLKTDLTVKLQEELNNLNQNNDLEQKIEENLKNITINHDLKKKTNELKGKRDTLEKLISRTDDPEEKQRLINEKSQLDVIIANNIKEYNEKYKKYKLESAKLKELQEEQNLKKKDIKQIKENLNEIKNIEINNDNVKISDEVKRVIIEEYNNEKEDIERKYKEKIDNENKIKLESIKEKILNMDIDPETEKKHMEDMAINREAELRKKYKEIEEKKIELEAESKMAQDFELDPNDSTIDRNEKLFKAGTATLNEMLGKVKLGKEELKIKGEDDFDIKKVRQERELKKKIKLASTNLQTKIDKLNNEFKEYKKSGNYSPEKVEEYEAKIAGFEELKNKLNDKNISSAEKQGLLALLGKGDWLKNYIKVRQDNYLYDAKGFSNKLNELSKKPFDKVEENEYTELYKKYLSSEKYSLIEEFAKLRAEIPHFENVSITDDLDAIATKLGGFEDEEILEKLGKLRELQKAILHFDAGYTKDDILEELDKKRLGEESALKQLREDIDRENKSIDLMDISEAEKQGMKLHNEQIFNQRAAKVKNNIEKINNEISKIEEIAKTEGKFSKDEIKEVSKNIDLFSIVGNYGKYGTIVDGIYEDILEGNTDFIDLESYKNIKADFYTTSKLNELSQKEILAIKESLENIPDNASPSVKQYKRKLVQELRRTEELKESIEKGRILEEGVIDYFKDENLYKIKLHENIKEILAQLNDPNLTDADKERLKKELSKQFVKLEKIEENKIGESLKEEIKEHSRNMELDKELINKELEDGFKNANTAKKTILSSYTGKFENLMEEAKDRWAMIGHEAKMTTKVIANELKNGKSIFEEDDKERKDRHKKIDKYVGAILVTGISGFFLLLPKFLNGLSSTISRFPKLLDKIKLFVEKNKSHIFIITLILVGLIVMVTPQSSFNFLNVNTKLYSILNYTKEAGNLQFSDTLGNTGEILYYKLNTYLFFIFLIVLYYIIIEFLHKYIEILKKPKIGIDMFMWSLLKLVIFFIYLTIIFRVNTFIG